VKDVKEEKGGGKALEVASRALGKNDDVGEWRGTEVRARVGY
jgi:hypothetical protein